MTDTWRPRVSLPQPYPVTSVVCAPSGERIVVTTGFASYYHSLGTITVLDAAGTVLRRTDQEWEVRFAGLSPAGTLLGVMEGRIDEVTGVTSVRLRALDVESGAERWRCDGLPAATAMAFSPDGTSLAAIGWTDRDVSLPYTTPYRVWAFDAADGRRRWVVPIEIDEEGRRAMTLAWSPDSASIAVGDSRGITVHDHLDGAVRRRLPTPAQPIRISFTSDGARIVASCYDSTLSAIDATTGATTWRRQLRDRSATMAISDDGRWLGCVIPATSPAPATLDVYDMDQGTPRFVGAPAPSRGNRIQFSSTLRHIAVSGRIGDVSVHDARTGRRVDAIVRTGVTEIAFSPDGRRVVAGGHIQATESHPDILPTGFVEMYDATVEVATHHVAATPTAVATSPRGTPLVAVADNGSALTVLLATTGQRLLNRPVPGTIAAIAFAQGGESIAVGGSAGVRSFAVVGDRTWKADGIGEVNDLAVGSGEWIAVAAGRTARLLAGADGREHWAGPNTHPQSVLRIAASGDGRWIATGCADRGTRVLDAATGTETARVGADGRIRAVEFQPGHTLLATGNEDGTVTLLDAATGAQRRVRHGVGCTRLAFGPTLLAVAWDDNTVTIHNLTGAGDPPAIRQITCPAPVSALAFHPAVDALAVATASTRVAVHDLRTGIELARYLAPRPVRDVAFSSDGALLATADLAGDVRVWASELALGGA
ncbi:PQQ-binding-like beta-propeller repeat protein [Amycolatopsis sp. NPDC051045]|uniref:WD40 repeat domain-containing protein n=1 Tax=Amycolatopsis sp. NPDC051045 TaxID=3156922 RepID=UPI0034170E0A